jgi:PAS domain S-box-containing protein
LKRLTLKELKKDVKVTAAPITCTDRKKVEVVQIDRDIKMRKEQEKAEKSKTNEINLIIDGIGDLLFVIDENRVITRVNKSTCEFFKKKPEELIGNHCYEAVHGTKAPWCNCPATKTFETKQTVTEEVNDPNVGIPLLVTTSPILDEQGEVKHVIHIAKDITKIKLAEMETHVAANLFDAISDTILLHDLEGNIVYFNEAANQTRGFTRDEFQTLNIKDLEYVDNPRFFEQQMKKLFDNGEATFEAANLRKDKTVMPVEIHSKVIEFDGKKLVLSVVRDITERKKLEKEKNSLLLDLGERVKELNSLYGISRIFEKSDTSLEIALQRTVELLPTAMRYPDITCARIAVANQEFSTKNFKETPWKLQADIKTLGKKVGFVKIIYLEERPTAAEGPFLKEERQLIDAIAERLGKIIERKDAEEKLKESQEKYETTFESSRDALMLFKEEGFFDCNTATLQLFGIDSVKEFSKYHPADLSPPKQPDGSPSMEAAIKHINKAFETGMDSFFWIHKRADGTTFPANVLLTRMTLKGRKILQATVRDITEQQKANDLLKKSEEKYRKFANSLPEIVFEVNDKGKFTFLNQKASELMGYTIDEMKQATFIQFLAAEDRQKAVLNMQRRIQGEKLSGNEYKLLKKDGSTFPAVIFSERIIQEDGKIGLSGVFVDISQIKEAEERQITLLNTANVLIQSVNVEGKFIYVNNEWKKVLGYTDQDLEKITLTNVIRKDHLTNCLSVFDQVMKGKSIYDVETVFVAKDGKEFVVSGNVCPVYKESKFVSTVGFFADITERKKTEEKLKENSERIAMMNEKLRVMGGLTRHDVRNKLFVITGNTFLLKKKHADQADIVNGLSKIEQAIRESVKIFDFAKIYEALGVEELSYVDVGKAADEATSQFPDLTFKVVNNCQGLTVFADSLLKQLFFNFIDNTRKYGKKTTTVRLYFEKLESGDLRLIYEDDGVGISQENKLKLFTEGFSTGGSTGFGLFLIKKMIEVYGWTIQENGTPDKGAKFTLTIPKLNKSQKENYQISTPKEANSQ